MTQGDGFLMEPGWRLLLADMGIDEAELLRRAGLSAGVLSETGRISAEGFFAFWSALESMNPGPQLPLRVAQSISPECFNPSLFAVICSPNLTVGFRRLAVFKRLIAPLKLTVTRQESGVRVSLMWLDALSPPPMLQIMELAYFVHLARLGTRHPVAPLSVQMPAPVPDDAVYTDYFGVPMTEGPALSVLFSSEDAGRPFLTANDRMWEVFEADLRRRLDDLDQSAAVAARVRAALIDGLPSALCGVDDVAERLGMSRRTLQRRLKDEHTSFQRILQKTREDLARHYLARTSLSASEIAFLLGFEETSSFFRAFQSWTGTTPEAMRRILTR